VADEGDSVHLNDRVDRIAGLGVGMVEPRRENEKTAQITPVLMRDDVVWIIAPCTFEAKGTNGFTFGSEASH
jgi:hypothetical protein